MPVSSLTRLFAVSSVGLRLHSVRAVLYPDLELVSTTGSLHADLTSTPICPRGKRQRRRKQNAVAPSSGPPYRLLPVHAAAPPRYASSHKPRTPGKQPAHSEAASGHESARATATSHSLKPAAAQQGCASALVSQAASSAAAAAVALPRGAARRGAGKHVASDFGGGGKG